MSGKLVKFPADNTSFFNLGNVAIADTTILNLSVNIQSNLNGLQVNVDLECKSSDSFFHP